MMGLTIYGLFIVFLLWNFPILATFPEFHTVRQGLEPRMAAALTFRSQLHAPEMRGWYRRKLISQLHNDF